MASDERGSRRWLAAQRAAWQRQLRAGIPAAPLSRAPAASKWPRSVPGSCLARLAPAPSCSAVYPSRSAVFTWVTCGQQSRRAGRQAVERVTLNEQARKPGSASKLLLLAGTRPQAPGTRGSPRTWQSSTHSTVSGTRTPQASQSCVMPTLTASRPVRCVEGPRMLCCKAAAAAACTPPLAAAAAGAAAGCA